jgi:hypothetical protein
MRCFLPAVLLLCCSSLGAGEIKPLRHWSGKIVGGKVKPDGTRALPSVPEQVVKDAKTWESLWKRLRGSEPVGKVDFTRELVLVATINTRDGIYITDIRLGEQGTLTYTTITTKGGGEGFGYTLVVVPSAGVKKVSGR